MFVCFGRKFLVTSPLLLLLLTLILTPLALSACGVEESTGGGETRTEERSSGSDDSTRDTRTFFNRATSTPEAEDTPEPTVPNVQSVAPAPALAPAPSTIGPLPTRTTTGPAQARLELQGQDEFPLHLAAFEGSVSEVEELLNRGEFVNAAVDFILTGYPQHPYPPVGTLEYAPILTPSNPEEEVSLRITGQTLNGVTPLELAAMNNSLSVVDLLVKWKAEINPEHGTSPLDYAAAFNPDPMVTQFLLDQGAEVNRQVSSYGGARQTPLHWAATYNSDIAVFEVLLNAGASVAARDDYPGGTPLHDAARWNQNPQVINMLLDWGADVDATISTRWEDRLTPLAMAATYNPNPAITAALLDGGASVYGAGPSNHTELHRVVTSNPEPAVVAVLLMGGADVNAKTSGMSLSPLHIAVTNPDPDLAVALTRLLLEWGADTSAGTKRESFQSWRYYAEDSTPLHRAVGYYWAGSINNVAHPGVLDVLLNSGANIEARDDEGNTPLHRAVQVGANPEAVRLLLDRGANVQAKNANGNSPLDLTRLGIGGEEAFGGSYLTPRPELEALLLEYADN